jgi:hypothetical protein
MKPVQIGNKFHLYRPVKLPPHVKPKKGEEEGGARKNFISAFWAFLHNTLIRLFEGFN